MNDRNKLLNKFYNEICDEDTRLDSKHTQLEFLTTDRYIQKYLKSGCKILEIGAGIGKYSLHYAKQGYQVNAIEYVEHNLDVLKSKITEYMNIIAEQGDAIDLSKFEDDEFEFSTYDGTVRVVRSVEKYWHEGKEKEQEIYIATNMLNHSVRTIIKIMHLRWNIENYGFRKLKQQYNLEHIFISE